MTKDMTVATGVMTPGVTVPAQGNSERHVTEIEANLASLKETVKHYTPYEWEKRKEVEMALRARNLELEQTLDDAIDERDKARINTEKLRDRSERMEDSLQDLERENEALTTLVGVWSIEKVKIY